MKQVRSENEQKIFFHAYFVPKKGNIRIHHRTGIDIRHTNTLTHRTMIFRCGEIAMAAREWPLHGKLENLPTKMQAWFSVATPTHKRTQPSSSYSAAASVCVSARACGLAIAPKSVGIKKLREKSIATCVRVLRVSCNSLRHRSFSDLLSCRI